MDHIRTLMASDLSQIPKEELVTGVQEGELLFDEVQRWVGRIVAELRRREPQPSWYEIAKLTAVPPTTLRNRVAKAEGET